MLLVSTVIGRLKNQRGNALMLALGCAAVVSAVSIEVWNRSELARHRNKQSSLKDDADVVREAIASRLQNPDDCTDALAGEALIPGQNNDITLHYVLDPDADPTATSLAAGTKVTTNGISVAALQLEVPAEDDFRTEILDVNGVPTELRRYPAFLHAVFADPSGGWLPVNRTARLGPDGSKEMDLGIPFYVWALPPPPVGSGQIQSCFGRNSAGTLCNELGGYFIPRVTPYDQSCRQSLKTLKRVNGTFTPLANCRVGGVSSTAARCAKYGVKFGGSQINGKADISPVPGSEYLCQVCQ